MRPFLLVLAAIWLTAPAIASEIQVPVGDVDLNIEETQIDEKLGPVFSQGLRSGANNCYVEALWKTPTLAGEITFLLKPPPHDGDYIVTLQKTGSIDDALADCVKGIFRSFYHYENKGTFDHVHGTLHFAPRFVTAPAPPSETELRALLDARYAESGMVRILGVTLRSLSHDVSASEVFRRYRYDVELELTADGYEATCRHYDTYKIFGRQPWKTPYAGHTCENQARKAGEHTSDRTEVDFRLALYPEVGTHWEPRGGGVVGTAPTERASLDRRELLSPWLRR